MIAFILPSVFYLKEFKDELNKRQRITQYCIIGFGIFGALFSIVYTILQIVDKKHK
jgi:hypothetical protein